MLVFLLSLVSLQWQWKTNQNGFLHELFPHNLWREHVYFSLNTWFTENNLLCKQNLCFVIVYMNYITSSLPVYQTFLWNTGADLGIFLKVKASWKFWKNSSIFTLYINVHINIKFKQIYKLWNWNSLFCFWLVSFLIYFLFEIRGMGGALFNPPSTSTIVSKSRHKLILHNREIISNVKRKFKLRFWRLKDCSILKQWSNLNFLFKSLRSEIIFALAKLIDVPFGKNAIFDYIDSMLKI